LANEKPGVVVDLSRVKKMDLSGIEALLTCMEEVARQDGSVELGGISPEAATLLELTRVNELFQKFPSSQVGTEGTVVLGEPATEVEPTGTRAVQPQPVAA
jgi:anti-anti-sigma factor